MQKVVIIGKGGHAKSVVDTIERQGIYEVAGYIVNEVSDKSDETDYPVIGSDDQMQQIYESGITNAVLGIGFLGKGELREKLYKKLKNIGFSFPVICDESAIVSKNVIIGEGTFVGKNVVINTGSNVGKMCIINTGAIVEHDCKIGDFSHIAVSAVLCGGVQVGERTLIGANATIIQCRAVGTGCIVPAGEVVRKDMDSCVK